MILSKLTQDDEEITLVGVPNPNRSGEHCVLSLEHVEALLARVNQQLAESGDPNDPAFMYKVYLLGFRDALMGRKPNVPG